MTHQEIKLLNTIKPNALNKGRARTWIESKELAAYGFARHARITIDMNADNITIRLDPNGKRKVAGRPDKQILDICEPVEQRDARWGSAERLRVDIAHGLIIVRAI